MTIRANEAIVWVEERKLNGVVAYRLGKTVDGFVAEWPGIGCFRSRGSKGTFEPVSGANVRLVAKLERGIAHALARHTEGKITLHGGAACRNGAAIAFVGPSGSGKSTVTAFLCANRGFRVLADDVIAIDEDDSGFIVSPTEDEHWLWDDACRMIGIAVDAPKSGYGAIEVGTSAKLVAIISLRNDGNSAIPELSRLRGHRTMTAVMQSMFRLELESPSLLRRDLDAVEKLCRRVPVWELHRSRQTSLESVGDLVETLFEAL